MDKVDYYETYANIDILATQALFVMQFSPYSLKITQITIMFKLFSNLIPIWKNLPSNLNKDFIEPPCMYTSAKDAVKTLARIVEMHYGVTCLEVEYNLDS